MESETKTISTTSILVSARIRKEAGDLTELAESIRNNGLINPITVMDCQNGQYQLIAGLRRLEAAKFIQMTELCATVLSPLQAEEMLEIEIAENEQRLNFTTAERLEYAEKIKAIEVTKARERMSLHARDGYKNENQGMLVRAYPDKGNARNAIAKRTEFSSGCQYERALTVADKRPDLLPKIDSGETTIFGAYKETVKKGSEQKESEALSEKSTISTDQVARAGIIRLMKNPHFMELRKELEKLQSEATSARTKLKWATEGYVNKVKHFENNIGFLSRRVKELEDENDALRARLGMEARAIKRVEFGNPDGIIKNVDDTIS